jgi:hypothetical protein
MRPSERALPAPWGAVLDGRDERERLRLVLDAAAEGTLAPRVADAASVRGGAP